jgi:Tfp pilus assembly protein PilX
MKLRLLRKGERGAILIIVSIVVMIISVLGIVYTMNATSTHRLTLTYKEADQARALALAGAEYAVNKLAYGLADPMNVDFADEVNIAGTTVRVNAKSSGSATVGTGDGMSVNLVVVESEATVRGITRSIRATFFNNSYEIHELYYKAIFAANRHGIPYTLEFTGANNDADRIRGDAHNNGDIEFSLQAFSTWNWGNNKCTATGECRRVDATGETNLIKDKSSFQDPINAPNLQAMGYEDPTRRYREWDGTPGDIVDVGDAWDYYRSQGQTFEIDIAREGGYFSAGGYYEWNTRCEVLPDSAAANFFQYDYQNHYCDDFTAADDAKVDLTKNYYLGQRNGGTYNTLGNDYGLYGGGHAVITITEEQNNKIYFVDGNLWLDSDGCNHLFFVPDDGVDKVAITIVVKGNIYIGDQVWTTGYDKSMNIGGSTSAQCFQMLDEDSSIAFVAMSDGESYDDVNRNGTYDPGETIIGRADPSVPNPAENNPEAPGTYTTDYQGRREGSGNIIFGDTIQGPVGAVEAFLYAENNFQDITADTSQGDQNPFTFGNMTAGNRVFLKRNYEPWESVEPHSGVPAGWVKIGNYYYPPGTTVENRNNPFVTDRMYYNGKIYARRHNPLQVKLDDRIRDGSIKLPGLPTSNETFEGTWVPVLWEVLERAILPQGWTPDP